MVKAADRAGILSKTAQIKKLSRRLESAQNICVTTRLYIHGKNLTGDPCMCCDSKEATVIEIKDDLQLLIDPIRQRRKLRRDAKDKAKFDKLVKKARNVEIKLRCTPEGYAVLTDETPLIGIGGSARAGKTQISLGWFTRQWMLRGGPGARLWIVGPQVDHAHTALNKLILGEYEDGRFSPPIMPIDDKMNPILALSWPTSLRATDQTCYMIDGSKIELRHSKPSRIRGVSIQAGMFTEAADVASIETFAHLRARIVTTQGQLLVESTFKDTLHWFQTDLKQLAVAEHEEKERNPDHVELCHWYQFLAPGNVWNSDKAIKQWGESIKDDVMYKREFLGIAADEQNRMWADVWNDTNKPHLIFDDETWNLENLGLIDVTKKISRRLFKKPVEFICGMDFNVFPYSAVICKVGATDPDNEKTYKLIVRDVVQLNGGTVYDFIRKVNERYREMYKGRIGAVVDVNSKWDNDPSHVGKSQSTVMQILERNGQIQCRAPDKHKNKIKNPPIRMSCTVVKRMMREHRIKIHSVDGEKLIFALENQLDNGAGVPMGKGGRGKTILNERMNSPVDGLRYICWALFKQDSEVIVKKTRIIRLP